MQAYSFLPDNYGANVPTCRKFEDMIYGLTEDAFYSFPFKNFDDGFNGFHSSYLLMFFYNNDAMGGLRHQIFLIIKLLSLTI